MLDQVSKRLRKLSDTAVRGCEAVWRAAASLWGELAKTALARERELAAEKRRLARKKAKEKEEVVERKKARERIRKSFLWELRVLKAKEGARRLWNYWWWVEGGCWWWWTNDMISLFLLLS